MLKETREAISGKESALVPGILLIAILYFAREVFVPLALAGLLAFLLTPAANRLERWGFKRIPAALCVILLSLSALGAVTWVVLGQVYNLAVELPRYQQNVTGKIEALHLNSAGTLTSTIEMLSSISKQISNGDAPPPPIVPVTPRKHASAHTATPPIEAAHTATPASPAPAPVPVPVRIEAPEQSMLAVLGHTMLPLIHPLTTILIVVIFLIFMLFGREDLRDRGLRLAGSGRMHVTTSAMEDASRRVSQYLQMQLIVNLSYGVVAGLSLWLIGVPNPLLWAVLIALLRFVPYVGILMAAAGPLLLAVAVSPGWTQFTWTVVMFVVLELVTANFVEPLLYGSSTGISAMAILIAAIFWTLLWGLPGLLLSTPLTVCLVVIGRQVPRLHYLDVLFGEETALQPVDRFYQRLLASNTRDAAALITDMLKSKSREEVYDNVLIPALTMIEESRQSEEMSATRAEEVLQAVEELAEDVTSRSATTAPQTPKQTRQTICVPARGLADEVACQLALQVLTDTTSVRVISADNSTSNLFQSLEELRPDVVCIVGVPPRAIRYIRMRSHQIRSRFPDAIVVACVLSKESELSNLRSRIPTEDAQHVVCSLQLMKEYLASLLQPVPPPAEASPVAKGETKAGRELGETVQELQQINVLDGPEEDIFNRLTKNLARSFDAPIALITVADGHRHFWEAQCGLPEDTLHATDSERDLSICSRILLAENSLVVEDTSEHPEFAKDPFLKERGIRFYAGAPLKSHEGEVLGSVCVLDTRPRQVSDQLKDMLVAVADSVMTAIDLRGTASREGEDLVHEP